jgi:hypothetical protein
LALRQWVSAITTSAPQACQAGRGGGRARCLRRRGRRRRTLPGGGLRSRCARYGPPLQTSSSRAKAALPRLPPLPQRRLPQESPTAAAPEAHPKVRCDAAPLLNKWQVAQLLWVHRRQRLQPLALHKPCGGGGARPPAPRARC